MRASFHQKQPNFTGYSLIHTGTIFGEQISDIGTGIGVGMASGAGSIISEAAATVAEKGAAMMERYRDSLKAEEDGW